MEYFEPKDQQPNLISCECVTDHVISQLQLPSMQLQLPLRHAHTFPAEYMIRVVLGRSLALRFTRGNPCVSRLRDVDGVSAVFGPLFSTRLSTSTTSFDMSSESFAEDAPISWVTIQTLVAQGHIDPFVEGVYDYLKRTGGRGGGGLVNRLYKCFSQVI